MLRRTLVTVGGLTALLVLVGCGVRIEGSGVEGSETRDVAPFNRLSLSGAVDAVVTVGGAQAVSIRGDDNLLAEVKTETDDGTLRISQSDNVDLEPTVGITVVIAVPSLEEVSVSGAGDVTVTGIRAEAFRTEVSGAGNVEAAGEVTSVEVEISGAGDVRLADLVAREATVQISGAGDVDVHATDSLNASISGAGDVVYSGDPEDVKTDVSGAGEIHAA